MARHMPAGGNEWGSFVLACLGLAVAHTLRHRQTSPRTAIYNTQHTHVQRPRRTAHQVRARMNYQGVYWLHVKSEGFRMSLHGPLLATNMYHQPTAF